jgi:hypothetical protein
MLRLFSCAALLWSSATFAQVDARAELTAALESDAPVPSRPLGLPSAGGQRSAGLSLAAASAQRRASEGARSEKFPLRSAVPGAERANRHNLSTAGQLASGQARAEAAKKKSRKMESLRPAPGGPP